MPSFQKTLSVRTSERNEIVDLTEEVAQALRESGAENGQCLVYAPHATAAVTVNEGADPNVGVDFLAALRRMVPEHGGWLHDRVDNNAAAHIKSAVVGVSVTIPVHAGRLALGTWQRIFFCEFDGPRSSRKVVVSFLW